jgi:hypothetical protein
MFKIGNFPKWEILKLRHMSKTNLLRKEGKFPVSIQVPADLIAKGREILDNDNWIEEEQVRLDALRRNKPSQLGAVVEDKNDAVIPDL